MGAEISLKKHSLDDEFPAQIPYSVIPIQQNSALVKGNTRAVLMEINGKKYWVTNNRPLQLIIGDKKANFYLTKETLTMPFELVLDRFKMDKDPGTDNPASYESFVKLFTNEGPSDHHIYMNNPLKFSGFTFYQASYGQDDNGNYFTTLSVNVDQGRPLKYLGSAMLVLGAILHYYLNRQKKIKQ